jgi:hypothetical protein
VTFTGENLTFTESIVRSEVPPEIVRGIQWKPDQAVETALKNPRTDRDRVVVMGEEQPVTLDGIIEGIDTERLLINYEGQSRTIQMDKVLAVVFADLQQGNRATLTVSASFGDGSRITGSVLAWQQDQLTMAVRGAPLTFASSTLSRLDVRSGRLLYVSEIEDLEIETKPIFAPPRSLQRDRSVEGNPIRLRMPDGKVQTFRRGFGVAAYSRIRFRNSGDFDRLLGMVGIDAETEGRGNCRVLIRGDGITLWERQLLGTQPAESLELDVSGVSQIEFIVESGELFDLSDHVSWANVRLLKQN